MDLELYRQGRRWGVYLPAVRVNGSELCKILFVPFKAKVPEEVSAAAARVIWWGHRRCLVAQLNGHGDTVRRAPQLARVRLVVMVRSGRHRWVAPLEPPEEAVQWCCNCKP